MHVTRNGARRPIVGSAENFTGTVHITQTFAIEAPGRVTGGTVSFDPGARSHWHTHPFGQVLIVTEGVGWTQCEGEPVVEIRAGDVVCCPANTRHWHGATASTAMTHVAVAEALDGSYANWMEPVTEEQYHGPQDSDTQL